MDLQINFVDYKISIQIFLAQYKWFENTFSKKIIAVSKFSLNFVAILGSTHQLIALSKGNFVRLFNGGKRFWNSPMGKAIWKRSLL